MAILQPTVRLVKALRPFGGSDEERDELVSAMSANYVAPAFLQVELERLYSRILRLQLWTIGILLAALTIAVAVIALIS